MQSGCPSANTLKRWFPQRMESWGGSGESNRGRRTPSCKACPRARRHRHPPTCNTRAPALWVFTQREPSRNSHPRVMPVLVQCKPSCSTHPRVTPTLMPPPPPPPCTHVEVPAALEGVVGQVVLLGPPDPPQQAVAHHHPLVQARVQVQQHVPPGTCPQVDVEPGGGGGV